MPAVVALSDSFVASLPKGWDATVRIKQANGTTDATVYKDANGDATGANPLPLASAEFGRNYDGNGGWQCYLVPGDYVVSVTPHGGSEHHASVTVTAAAPPVSRGLYEVYGTPSVDVPVPTWNPTTGRLEFAAGGGGGGGASEQSWIAANQNGDAVLTSSESPVQWVVESSSATPPWQLHADGHTWECLVAGQYIIYAEPVLTYTVGDSSQGANVFVHLRPTLAADDALIYYPNNQWDYWFTPVSTGHNAPGVNNSNSQYYQSYSSVPAAFDVGDTFHIGAGVLVGTGNDSVTSNSAHTIAIVKIG